jgi:hypothetical protein
MRAELLRQACDDWLQPLELLLAPLRPERLAVVGGGGMQLKVQWTSRLPDDAVLIEPRDACLIGRSGWLFQLPSEGTEPQLLFLVTDHEDAASEAMLESATGLVRCAWRLRRGAGEDSEAAELAEAIHALRNSLNSVLMSAAVITTCADLLPERLQPIAREIEAAAARSVQRLHRMTGLIESRP